jgi:hypothetical protein
MSGEEHKKYYNLTDNSVQTYVATDFLIPYPPQDGFEQALDTEGELLDRMPATRHIAEDT